MKFTGAVLASALCLLGIVDAAKVHRVGLKKVPKEDMTVVCSP